MSTTTAPMQYLDKAMNTLHEIGLARSEQRSADDPMTPLLTAIVGLDEARVTAIARTFSEAATFNTVVRQQVQSMDVGTRFEEITNAFNSIRHDVKAMVDQLEDDQVDTLERVADVWMKTTRGSIPSRFEQIKNAYLEVIESANDQIQREKRILDAYQDFRRALKASEVLAMEVLNIAETKLEAARAEVDQVMQEIEVYSGDDAAARARLELGRDHRVRVLQDIDKRYQIAKDLADNLTVSYNTSEVVMGRLLQATNAKERLYQQSISFFTTNETVLTALSASFTGLLGLAETTQSVNAMNAGINQSRELLAKIDGKVQEETIKAGYGPPLGAQSVKKLVDSVVHYQTCSREIIEEMRIASTRDAGEIREAVEDGKRRMTRLAEQGHDMAAA